MLGTEKHYLISMQKMNHYRTPTYANQTYMSIPPGNLGANQVKFSARVLKGDKHKSKSAYSFSFRQNISGVKTNSSFK